MLQNETYTSAFSKKNNQPRSSIKLALAIPAILSIYTISSLILKSSVKLFPSSYLDLVAWLADFTSHQLL